MPVDRLEAVNVRACVRENDREFLPCPNPYRISVDHVGGAPAAAHGGEVMPVDRLKGTAADNGGGAGGTRRCRAGKAQAGDRDGGGDNARRPPERALDVHFFSVLGCLVPAFSVVMTASAGGCPVVMRRESRCAGK